MIKKFSLGTFKSSNNWNNWINPINQLNQRNFYSSKMSADIQAYLWPTPNGKIN